MRVNPRDGTCRECGEELEIIDADDATMTMECVAGHLYVVESDAFDDGCMTYLVGFLTGRDQPLKSGEHDGPASHVE
jgi:hypothetical protein